MEVDFVTGTSNGVTGTVSTDDYGLLARLTPVNSMAGQSLIPLLDDAAAPLGGLRIDIAYGTSRQSSEEAVIEYTDGRSDPITNHENKGFGVHASIGVAPAIENSMREGDVGFLVHALSPALAFGWSNQQTTQACLNLRERDIDNAGWELTILNIFTIRRGDIDDPNGDIRGSTSGWGVGFELEGLGGFRYDRAEVPQASGLDRVERSGFMVTLDPVGIYKKIQ